MIRYLRKTSGFAGSTSANRSIPISYDYYECGNIRADVLFDGPTQQLRLRSLALGLLERWTVRRRVGRVMTNDEYRTLYNEWNRTGVLPRGY